MPGDVGPSRPSPDELLAQLAAGGATAGGEQAERRRGQLKIFFGMAPGVGKTYAMLAAAQRMAAQGVDVVAGIVETHGRVETEQMLLGLDILPRRRVEYRGPDGSAAPVWLTELDVEAAIARRPDILLVDELAHTNAPGGREKRWQDVLECLKAGVDVYTTLNVQHLESLNDVVAQITGVAVRETVPDSVFDEADEVELVDLGPDVLHERLRAGKVYLGDNVARAVDPADGFFRKGNLTALRELALRRTAAWVDSELRRYKLDRGIRTVWPAGDRVLVAVSPSPMSGKLVRAAKRMAAGLHADLLAVYVETPRTAELRPTDRERLSQNMRLAESLGASTTTLTGDRPERELIAFARSRNVSRIVVGKTARTRWRDALFGSFINNLIRESGDIDVYVVRGDEGADTEPSPAGEPARAAGRSLGENAVRYGLALGMVALVTLLGMWLFRNMELANTSMAFLAVVVVVALWLGRGPAIMAALLGVAAFDFFFVPPRLTFAVSDVQYLLTFVVMTAVGLIIGTLAARSREQARAAAERERRTASLFALSRELAAARDARDVGTIAARHVHDTLNADVVVAVPAPNRTPTVLDVIAFAGEPDWFTEHERGVAQWAMDHGKPAGRGTQKLPASQGRYTPLAGTGGRVGVLAVRQRGGSARPLVFDTAALAALDAMASQVASSLERVWLNESRQAARLEAERERLRSALLSSVSHDLRTPLASITGAASALEQSGEGVSPMEPATRSSLVRSIIDEASRLSDIISNLVFATRLESGGITLNREWTTVEEVVGVGLARHHAELAGRPFRVQLPEDLPMIHVDNAMLPQVVHNLVENSLRYAPPGTPISIAAWVSESQVVVKVADEGPGLAEDEAARVFQRFYRGRASKSAGSAGSPGGSTGMGLGLTICEGVIRAHGGRIWAEPNRPRGVAFLFSLPVEYPQPAMPAELAAEKGAAG